ncbi:aminomethyltransferase folate-binding domain-containing protein [Sarocladium implicatum]|nr:aminomethyltransferase folate-binding domain-containing protein [Sarocladium implicatum]
MPRLPQRQLVRDTTSLASLCRSCLLQRRSFASSAPPAPPSSGIAQLSSRQLLSVAGPDALKFLQGIVTANLAGKGQDGAPRPGYYAGFLNATGRVVHDVFIYRDLQGLGGASATDVGDGEAFLVEVDAGQADRLAKYIKRYKLRAKVNLRKISSDEVSVWQAWDDAASSGSETQSKITANDTNRFTMRDPRAPGLGYRILQAKGQVPALDLETSTQDAYTVRRYLHGVAEGQEELLRETALPQESNMDMMNGIDFHKGCYVGQELTIRTKHRGVVRKRILPCLVYPKEAPQPQSLTYDPAASIQAEAIPTEKSIGRFEKRGRSAGKWLRGVGNVGLALCRLETMTDVTLPGELAATSGFNAEDEFVVEWGGEGEEQGVKVKAFVPEWLRAGLEGRS